MTRKQRRLTMIGGSLAVLAVAAALVLNAMRDSIVFFSTPSMVAEKHIAAGKRFRLGGLVQPGSLVRGDHLAVSFQVADGGAALVGIDAVNIDDAADGRRPAHSLLLAAGIPVVEHLTGLGQLPPAGAWFTAVPLRIEGFGTIPVRAFARLPD